MSALIKHSNRTLTYLGAKLHPSVETRPTRGQGTLLKGGVLSYLTGKQQGQELDTDEGITKSTLKLSFGVVCPKRYEFLLSVHPKILEAAMVSSVGIYPVTMEESELFVVLRPFKSLDLQSLPWQICLHVID